MKLPADPRSRAWTLAVLLWVVNIPLLIAPALVSGGVTPAALVTVATLLICGPLICIGLHHWLQLRALGEPRGYLGAAVAGVVVSAILLGLIDNLGGLIVAEIGLTPHRPLTYIAVRAVTNTIFVGWIFGIFAAATLLIDFNSRLKQREEQLVVAEGRTAQARATATAARLAALRYQLNPHFLFNTLNAVSSAVVTNRNAEAEAMLTRLASFLRVTLTSAPTIFVRLEDELETVEAYLEIEAERFRDRLLTRIDCPSTLREASVPGFILQPLIENAMKHGVSRSRGVVTVEISVAAAGETLVIEVADNARALSETPPASGGGIGLSAVRERLEVLYGADASLQTARLDPGFRVAVRLPLTLAGAEEELA